VRALACVADVVRVSAREQDDIAATHALDPRVAVDRAPLLFISGGSDHILPPVIQRHNYEKNAKHSTAIAAHKVFPGRDHFTCGEPGWEAVADFALDWALAPAAGELG
jgi:pimeloyl-ACP methyl ester carboxylesterase